MSSRLREAFATEQAKRRYVRGLFATIADRYDLITRLLSYGRDRAWKARLVSLSGAAPGQLALDLASGTGDIAFGIAGRGASVVGLDFTDRMVRLAAAKRDLGDATFLVGDMMALPFGNRVFDLVTVGYGIRNVSRIEPALAEAFRVLRPGGLMLSLDFNRPEGRWSRAIYMGYLRLIGGALGYALHRDPDTYRYIPESIQRYPGAAEVARMMQGAGFVDCRVVPLLSGLMAINMGRKT